MRNTRDQSPEDYVRSLLVETDIRAEKKELTKSVVVLSAVIGAGSICAIAVGVGVLWLILP